MIKSAVPDYKLSISKEDLAKLPAAHYHGKICVVEKEEDVTQAVAYLRNSDVVGFDTETRPSFKKGQTNTVSLLQLSTRDISFLFRLNKLGMPAAVKEFIEDPDVLKIGLSIHDDFHNLNKITEISPGGFIDLQSFVKNYRIADNSLARIYAIVFGQRISKGQRLTNWEASSLTENQQAYAALDSLACIEIYDRIMSGEFNPEASVYKVPAEDTPEEKIEQAAEEDSAEKSAKATEKKQSKKAEKVSK